MERRDATPAIVLNWLLELARTLPGLLPGGPLSPATTHRILVAVSDEHAAGTWTYVHDAWLDFRGAPEATDDDEPFVGYARACAREQRPLDTTVLDATLPKHAVTRLRALVARGELANLTADAADRLVATLTGRRTTTSATPHPVHLVWDAALATIGAPLAATGVAAATAARLVQRLAPPPRIETPDGGDGDGDGGEPNLLTHVVAETLRAWTANAGVRLVLLRLPFTVTIALRDGLAESSVRLGRGRAAVVNGIAPDAVLLVEGELGPVLRNAATAAIDHLGHVRIRKA